MENNKRTIVSRFGAWCKERVRKFFVALKKNPQSLPLVALIVAFVQYSLNLSDISDSTAIVQAKNMGLAAFVTMLLMILSFVCMLNAFPKRQKRNLPMNILLRVLYAIIIFMDWHYLGCLESAIYHPISPIKITKNTIYLYNAYNTVNTHMIIMAVLLFFVIFEPIFAFLLKKINTSIEVEGGKELESIDISDEE